MLSIDPKAAKYPAWSPYNFAVDNPVFYIDPDGEEPREGNNVLHVNMHKAKVTKIYSEDVSGFTTTTYDKSLYWEGWDEYNTHDPLTGLGGGGFARAYNMIRKVLGLTSIENDIKRMEEADKWIRASRSSKGYMYEVREGEHIVERKVENKSKSLGKGYENLVTQKRIYKKTEKGEKKLVQEERWRYNTEKTEEGKKRTYKHEIKTEEGWKTIEEGELDKPQKDPEGISSEEN